MIAAADPVRHNGSPAREPLAPPRFLVQLRYELNVPGAGPDGWLTVGGEPDFAAAVHAAAIAYASRRDPFAGPPMGVRVRSEDQLRRMGGDEAVLHARLAVGA